MYGDGCFFTYSIQLALVSTLSGAPPSAHPSPCVNRNVGASARSRYEVSPRTTAASVAFSNASTSAIAADSALPGVGVPGGTRLGGALVFGLHAGSLANCAVRPAISTTTTREDVKSARIIQPPDYERATVSPAIRYASKINDTARAQSRAVAGGGSPRPIRSRHSCTTLGQPLKYPFHDPRRSSRPG